MGFIKKLWKKYLDWLFKDFYKQTMWLNIASKCACWREPPIVTMIKNNWPFFGCRL